MSNYPTVQIVSYTGHGTSDPTGYAARLLAFTKNTRLNMTPSGFDKFLEAPWEEIEKELGYMVKTIPSSWEFVDVTFAIRDVTRACAQQITRTRFTPIDGDIFGAYAMQSQRVTDMSAVGVHIPESVKHPMQYKQYLDDSLGHYKGAIECGESQEDARGLLPMNAQCNLIAKYNLRNLVEMLRARDSLRVQGEYQEVARQMKAAVIGIWPWAEPFFVPKDAHAIELIEDAAKKLKATGTVFDSEIVVTLAKAADLLKKN